MDATAFPPPRRGFRRYLPDALLLLVLLALTLKLGYHISAVRDLGTDDETYYLAHGHYLAKWGLPEACYSPLYVLWYWGWDQLKLERAFVYYANWAVLMYLLAAGGYVLVRALGGFRVVALAVGFLILTSGVADVWPYPMHLATFVLAAGAAVAARLRSWTASLFALGAALAVASYLRAEFTLSFLLLCPVWLACAAQTAWRHRAVRARVLLLLSLLVGLVGGLYAAFGNPLTGGRSFFAFGQHYSLNLWAQHRTEVDPWTNWEALTRADFGDATTVTQAIRNNPRAVLWHISCNLSYIPGNLADLTCPDLGLDEGGRLVVNLAVAAAAALGALGHLLRLFRPSLAADTAGRPVRVVLVLLLFIVAPAILSIVFIYPRMHYLIPLATFVGALAFAGYGGFSGLVPRPRWAEAWPALAAAVALLVLVTPNRAHRWSPQQRWGSRWMPAAPSFEIRRTVAAMRGLNVRLPKPIVVLEPDYSRAFYAGWDCSVVAHSWKNAAFWQFLANTDISVIVLNERLLTDTRYRDDPEFLEFVAGKKTGNFRFFDVPGTTVRLAVREDLLPESQPHAGVRP
jgi:hypothetical protein